MPLTAITAVAPIFMHMQMDYVWICVCPKRHFCVLCISQVFWVVSQVCILRSIFLSNIGCVSHPYCLPCCLCHFVLLVHCSFSVTDGTPLSASCAALPGCASTVFPKRDLVCQVRCPENDFACHTPG